jgi:hypothetical protein
MMIPPKEVEKKETMTNSKARQARVPGIIFGSAAWRLFLLI